MPAVDLSREDLHRLLSKLAVGLKSRGVEGRILIVGGAAMSLGHGRRRTTRDVDAQYDDQYGDQATMSEVAADVAREEGLRENWLSSSAAAFLPNIGPEDRELLEQMPGLRVELLSSRGLLAMKMAAYRATDREDLEILFEEMEIRSAVEAARITRQMYGEHAVVIADDEDEDLLLRAEEIIERVDRRRGAPHGE